MSEAGTPVDAPRAGAEVEEGAEERAERTSATRGRLLVLVPLVVFLALAVVFGFRLLSGGDPARVPSALIGRPVPALSLPPLDGLTVAGAPGLAEGGAPVPGLAPADLKGRVTVVNVWASWCAPCREEHPLLMALAREAGAPGAPRLVGIDYKDTPENGRRFLGAHGNPFAAVGVDPSGRAGIEWGVYGVPETFVVGPDGTIRHKQVGPLTPEALPAFREAVRAAANPLPR